MSAIAVLTITRNEGARFTEWLDYYVEVGDVFVLDHESDDGSTDDKRICSRQTVRIPTTDNVHAMNSLVKNKVRELLQPYRTVVFAEVDEFLVPNPKKYRDLREFIEFHDAPDHLTAVGMDLLPGRTWCRNTMYDKTLICRKPVEWDVGFHWPKSGPRQAPRDDLLLIHTHFRDLDEAWNRIAARIRGKLPDPDPLSPQNKHVRRETFEAQFLREADRPNQPVPAEYLRFTR